MSKKYEILAPAGSVDALKCAVYNDADAVYLGLDRFNARMKAENFSTGNLRHWIDFCHKFSVKVFVALNTSVKHDEFADAQKMLAEIYNSFADGVILTDLALMEFAAKNFPPPFEIVASTQLNIHDVYGAKFVEQLGATTVVVARETPYENIKQIIEQTNLKVECFIHGAICVSQSGQCLLSSLVGGNSGNRGLCAQPCRQLYTCKQSDKEINKGYLLSAKDLCGLSIAKRLFDLGVSTYKIEGRNRRSQYAGTTAKVYSQLFQNSFVANKGDISLLCRVFNRGHYLSDAYLTSQNEGIIAPKTQGHIGEKVGVVKHGKLKLTEPVEAGDGFKILRNGIEVGGAMAKESGSFVSSYFTDDVAEGDSVYITSDISQLDKIDKAEKKLPVKLVLTAKTDKPLMLKAFCSDICVEKSSDFLCQKAQNKPTGQHELTEQLSKTGDSCYTISDIVFDIEDIFVPKSKINALRRDILMELDQKIVENYNNKLNRKRVDINVAKFVKPEQTTGGKIAVICRSVDELQISSKDSNIDLLIVKTSNFFSQQIDKFCAAASSRQIFFDVPSFADLNYVGSILTTRKNVGIVANNVGAVYFARTHQIPYVCGTGLNIFNAHIAEILTTGNSPYIVSNELTIREASEFMSQNAFQFVDGKFCVMKLQHCPYKLNFGKNCSNCQFQSFVYVDKMQNQFEIEQIKCPKCTFELVNGKKLSVVSKLKSSGNYLIDFDQKVLQHYVALNNGVDDGYVELLPYTKGRLFEKVN